MLSPPGTLTGESPGAERIGRVGERDRGEIERFFTCILHGEGDGGVRVALVGGGEDDLARLPAGDRIPPRRDGDGGRRFHNRCDHASGDVEHERRIRVVAGDGDLPAELPQDVGVHLQHEQAADAPGASVEPSVLLTIVKSCRRQGAWDRPEVERRQPVVAWT